MHGVTKLKLILFRPPRYAKQEMGDSSFVKVRRLLPIFGDRDTKFSIILPFKCSCTIHEGYKAAKVIMITWVPI